MMRLTDPGSCERVRHIVDRARRDQPLQHVRQGQGDREVPENRPAIGEVVGDRLYLKVPFSEKDDAKREVKARWDQGNRLWWVRPDTPREKLTRWL